MSDELPQDALPPPEANGHDAAPQQPESAVPPPEQPTQRDSGQLPIPYTPAPNPRVVQDRRRLHHRRKRFALYVLRNQRRRVEARSRSRQRALVFTIASILALIIGTTGTLTEMAYAYYQSEVPDLLALQNQVQNSDSVQIYDRYGTLIYQANYNGYKHSIAFTQIPTTIINATVAIEDKDFWHNDGIDFQSILRAAYADYIQHNPDANLQGASTITQQLIKNTILDSNQTLERKIREAILAYGMTVSKMYTKQQIITLYLDTIPYGPDIYGVDSAAFEYFGLKDDDKTGVAGAHSLDLAQASFLAGIPQNPNKFDPLTPIGFKNAEARQLDVLSAMVAQKYITPAQQAAVINETHTPGFIHPLPPEETTNLAPDFVQYVIDQLNTMVDNGQLGTAEASGQLQASRSGLKVYTTLDLPLQEQVQQIMANHLFCDDPSDYYRAPGIFFDNVSESTAVLAEQSTGDLRVLLGSWDYYANVTPTQCSFQKPYIQNGIYHPATFTPNPYGKVVDNKFDTARFGFRSPGSTFKLVDYSTAFEKGWFPAMTLNDIPTIFPDPGGPNGEYKPLDAEGKDYYGEMTIRKALQYSMDIPAIKTASFDTVPTLLQTMQRLGFTGYNGSPGLAMAIGSLGVHPIDMVQAYATIANYGRRIPFNGIDYILDGQGNEIYRYSAPRGFQVFSPQVSYLLTNVLSDNPERINDRPGHGFGFGGCSKLFLFVGSCDSNTGTAPFFFPSAAKTGTTDNLADDWTMGYTMDYVGGVWVGNKDEGDYMRWIDGVTGAAPIWHNMMLAAEQEKSTVGVGVDHTPRPFPVPQGVVKAFFSSNGITSEDWFLANNVPTTQGIGNGGPTSVCVNVTYATNDAWDYCTSPPKQPGKP
jgi:membrane peptidoglycan carboxypeptidase